ncbi:shikimate kinase [Glutamicibacter uratoxydans]|uniref:shikimate kinase n=1 Tax=Glutamicibacter uratoxydans TaxID=43667 RepID=UPI003D6F11A1
MTDELAQTAGPPNGPRIVLLGPAGSGKTTVAQLLARRLGCPLVDLDAVAEPYYAEAGWSMRRLSERIARDGRVAAERAWEPARAHAVQRAIEDHPGSVLALGAGHGSFHSPQAQAVVARALGQVESVVLLLPSRERALALRILRERCKASKGTDWISEGHDFLAEWHDDPFTRQLASTTVYTANQTPAQSAAAVLAACQLEAGARATHA